MLRNTKILFNVSLVISTSFLKEQSIQSPCLLRTCCLPDRDSRGPVLSELTGHPWRQTLSKELMTRLIRVTKRKPQGASGFTWTRGSGKVSLGKGHLGPGFRGE